MAENLEVKISDLIVTRKIRSNFFSAQEAISEKIFIILSGKIQITPRYPCRGRDWDHQDHPRNLINRHIKKFFKKS